MGCGCSKRKSSGSSIKQVTRSYSSANKGIRRVANSGKRLIRRNIK